MIVFNIRNLLLARGIAPRSMITYLRKTGMSEAVARSFIKGTRKNITTKQIDDLCFLLNVEPTYLLLWQADKKNPEHKRTSHPLLKIATGQPIPNINEAAKGLSINRLRELQEYIRKLDEEQKQENEKPKL